MNTSSLKDYTEEREKQTVKYANRILEMVPALAEITSDQNKQEIIDEFFFNDLVQLLLGRLKYMDNEAQVEYMDHLEEFYVRAKSQLDPRVLLNLNVAKNFEDPGHICNILKYG